MQKNKNELEERWRKSLKYETLARLLDLSEEQEKAAEKSDTVIIKSFAELEEEAREKILKRYDDWFHRTSMMNEDDRLNYYINALVNVYDPHTQYFPPKDKENFDIRFTGQLEGIGAQLTQKNEYIEVTRIIPGSPSWKQGELEVGDYITKVAQGKEDWVDIVDMRLDEAVLLIRGKKGTKVRLNIKKLDGTIKEITLVRDVVVLEETYAKSAIINDDKSGRKFGYIKLPSFYVDFSDPNGRNCFEDTEKEIEKLKEEEVEGIVFDLRDNGGGSLEDVVKIAGLFIEQGPIVQSRGRRNMKKTYQDKDPDIQFGGPLVVMVNAVSASASEIFAAAMQDYNRAVVVGSSSTYGKGTVQNFTELDRMVPKKPSDMKELGSLKLTIQKFYRINGGTTQLEGVVPDVVFPDYFNYMEFGEKFLDHAMPWDEITALTYNNWDLAFDKGYIEDISKERVKNDTLMILIEENGNRLENIRDNTVISLNYDSYVSSIKEREEEGKKYDRIGKDPLDIAVQVLNADLPEIEADTSKKARTDAWLADLRKDVYLVETFNILKDIDQSKKGEKLVNRSNVKNIVEVSTKPPYLEIVEGSLQFADNDNDNKIDAGETSNIRFVISNSGLGPALDLRVKIEETNQVKGLSYKNEYNIGELDKDKTQTIEIPIAGNMNLKDGIASFKISVIEAHGFGTDPVYIDVPLQSFIAPLIKIVDYQVSSQSGTTLEKRKPFFLQVMVQNIGQGTATKVKVNFPVPENVYLLSTNEEIEIGTLGPGESKLIDYSLVTNNQYVLETLSFQFELSEQYGKYSEDKDIRLALNQQVSNTKLVITGQEETTIPIVIGSLTSDVDKDIPNSIKKNPNRIALIIGNEDYSGSLNAEINVDFAINDAEIFRQYVQNTLGVEQKNIYFLQNATSGKMNQQIQLVTELTKRIGNEAELIFYFAGHGFPEENTKTPYLIPVDVNATNLNSAIKLSDVYKMFSETGASKITIFMDACFSGGGRGDGLLAARSVKVIPKEEVIRGNMVVFSATSGEQSALPYQREKHGMFSYFLFKKIKETNGIVTYGELADYLKENVGIESLRENQKAQDPEVSVSSSVSSSWMSWTLK